MEARIAEEFPGTQVTLVEAAGGLYEVKVNGELVYSKKATGRHPEWEEVRERLRERA
ncbi:MAG: Rdx family protein [Gemmatimonadetes bacterium]|nr:Rdx family protein [Gemmatimonadota bacterium]